MTNSQSSFLFYFYDNLSSFPLILYLLILPALLSETVHLFSFHLLWPPFPESSLQTQVFPDSINLQFQFMHRKNGPEKILGCLSAILFRSGTGLLLYKSVLMSGSRHNSTEIYVAPLELHHLQVCHDHKQPLNYQNIWKINLYCKYYSLLKKKILLCCLKTLFSI